MNEMNALDMARRLHELGEPEKACQAYTLSLADSRKHDDFAAELEAALYILQNGGNYKIAYDSFRRLYNLGQFRPECLAIMTQAFYEPNVKLLKARYEKNCKLLAKYPYLFRKDFLPFEWLPIRFYPYDDDHYAPFYPEEERFDNNIDLHHPVVSRNFFRDLEKPILAADVFSQYELEYLNDNVRPSEWVAKENHIYLHYTDWGTFCSFLQIWNLRELLKNKKFVFLIEEEIEQYPIDFRERFGIDYSRNAIHPLEIREINRLIWHTQLSAHNGGDFFNEVFDSHPNLIMLDSVMLEMLWDKLQELRGVLEEGKSATVYLQDADKERVKRLLFELKRMGSYTDKDILVFLYLCHADLKRLDTASRIVPALFCQPHFYSITYDLRIDDRGRTVLDSKQYEEIQSSLFFRGFKYIKTFTPMRRPTTSTAATVRFMLSDVAKNVKRKKKEESQVPESEESKTIKIRAMPDVLTIRVLNRSYMVDWQDRLFKDSVLVRFEDGKLNPKATFTALAAFLDLPYTDSLTYCSRKGVVDASSMEGNVLGFDPAAVYRTYDEYLGNAERMLLELGMRDTYERYGYGFRYYDGEPVDQERLKEMVEQGGEHLELIREDAQKSLAEVEFPEEGKFTPEEKQEILINVRIKDVLAHRQRVFERLLQGGLRFVNKNGQPLNFMPLLELDRALLEQPLYH